MFAHVADAVENAHFEVMIRTFALSFSLRFPMATILKPGKGLFRPGEIYGVLWDGVLHGPGGWRVEIDLILRVYCHSLFFGPVRMRSL